MRNLKQLLLSGFLISIIITAQPSDDSAPELTAFRLNSPIIIDGVLNEKLYQTAPFSLFIQAAPDNGVPATEQTEVWVGFDDASIYVGARLWDNHADSIITRMARRDANFNSDEFQVAIDSYFDKRSGYYFVVNPSNSIQDGTIFNNSSFDDTWDGIWESAVTQDSQGWTVEIRIPFSQLRFNLAAEISMGLGFGRMIKRKNEHSLSFSSPRGNPDMASRFGKLIGIRNIKPPRRIEVIPYVTSNYANLPTESDNPFYKGHDQNFDLGTDLKFGIGNNLTVDATLNPDFGQVEVDPSVINLTAYETFFDEKRPFFTEGASIFSFGSGGPSNRMGFNFAHPRFFYSRRIGRYPQREVDSDGWIDMPPATDILGAAKISGKLPSNLSVGSLSAFTQREFARVDEDTTEFEVEVEPQTSYNLVRVQKELQNGIHGIGGLATYITRSFGDQDLREVLADDAIGIGIDGYTFFNENRNWAMSGWFGYTQVNGTTDRITAIQEAYNHYFQKPDVSHVNVDNKLTTLRGWASRFELNKEKGHIRINSALGIISPGFETNDMGINFRSDQVNKHLAVGYDWYDPGEIFRFKSLMTAYMSNHNFAGDKINEMVFLFGHFQFLNYYGIHFITGVGPRTLDDAKLRGGPMVSSPAGSWFEVGAYSDSRKNVSVELEVEGSQGENGSNDINYDLSVETKLGTRMTMRITPEYTTSHSVAQFVMSIDDPLADTMYGTRYIFAQLDQKTFETSLRFDYTFTPRLTFQAYFQGLLAVGEYSDYKEFAKPRSLDYI
ncbi:MAG: carbohydrate binding family 9 domain-containing protein, partial [Candidatus Marinimicrobia bacterium]|nr:carbohydrate binding family 9 domain-containing protein [Candidatus Neomarinimicrobiota bacterium]